MKQNARFIIRPDKKNNVIIGINFESSNLKPNTIYEIQEIMGENIIKEMGESVIDKHKWGYTINEIIESYMGECLLTKKEFGDINKI